MPIDNALASVAVVDLRRAVAWYAQMLGRPPDTRPMPEVAEWRFERGGWLQVYQLPARAGHGSCTLAVTSLDEIVARLERLGIDPGERSSSEMVKTAMIADPDGNHIALAEVFDKGMAR